MTRVVVLGASGMLGSMVTDVLSGDPVLEVAGTVRSAHTADACRERLPEVDWRFFDAETDDHALRSAIDGVDWIVNAIGLTKPYVHDDDAAEVERAIRINGSFPFALAKAADAIGARVIQIGTDCVYSGAAGRYVENSPHDALDVYGKTKSLGEAALPAMRILRCSIIGPEPGPSSFLLEWVRRQPANARINGYADHLWNGVTTHAFARLCRGAIAGADAQRLQHVVPSADVTKADLLVMIARSYGRDDITVVPGPAPYAIDRTLRTEHGDANEALWRAAGYDAPPSVERMVADVAALAPRLTGLPT
jgi:dTDP-4-dehydrorhamnose reductase